MNPLEHNGEPAASIVQKLEARGFRFIFYQTRTKGPIEKGWTGRFDSAANYRGQNVGIPTAQEIEPGKFLVDIDFDWPDGVRLAKRLIPPTDLGWGRGDRTLTHALYTTSTPIPSKFYNHLDGTRIIELRGAKEDGNIGFQTMCPPSIHPNGETLEFRANGKIAHDDTIPRRVLLYAIACLLLKHFDHRGLVHDVRCAAAGFLLREGLTEQETLDVLRAVAEVTGNDVSDVLLAVNTTAARVRSGKPVTGKKALLDAMGEEGSAVIECMQKWLGHDQSQTLAEKIAKLNEQYAIVSISNKVVVMENRPDGSIANLWQFDEFRRRLVKNGPLADVWLRHRDGRQYDQLIYAMPGSAEQCGPRDYNGYLGFTVQPQAGDWSKNREHIRAIICANDDEIFEWVLNWCAALIQQPGKHAWTALVLHGGQGIGKGHFADVMLGSLFHRQQYVHVTSGEQLTGKFNEHLSGKALIFADESTWGGDPRAVDKLKGLITENTVPIERKFLPLVEEPSALHLIVASNREFPVAIDPDDRRYMALEVSEAQKQNECYFTALHAELDHGGRAAMLHDLLAHTVNITALRHPLSTTWKGEIITRSLPPIQHWWFETLQRGYIRLATLEMNNITDWPTIVPKTDLHKDYLQFLDMHHKASREKRSTETELGVFLRKHKVKDTRLTYNGNFERVWILPSLEECRVLWVAACGWAEGYAWATVETADAGDDLPY
jgi:hypothetical protein